MGSVLLIDAGNTRLKWQQRRLWQVEDEPDVLGQGAVTYRNTAWETDWQVPDGPASVWVGSVAGEAVGDRIRSWCQSQGFSAPTFVETSRECLGLRVGYRDVSRLGVDRFLAMVGARQRQRGALCVIDVGTALTLDAIDTRGMHHGGLIAPGVGTMVRSVLRGASNISDASRALPDTLFAKDTAEAVTGGACYAAAALIDRFVDAATARFGGELTTLVAGGGREALRPLVNAKLIDAPDLVFDGLMALSLAGGGK